MRHSWMTPLVIAGISTALVAPALAQSTGTGSAPSAAPKTSDPSPAPKPAPSTAQPGSPSVGTAPGTPMPGSAPSASQPGSGTGMTTGSKKAGSANGQASSEQVKNLQKALQDKGVDPGPIDGIMGPKTQAALRNYQKDQKLPETGRIDTQTLEKLGVSR
jgi:His-Xaa-Ser repeat protein HxsA